VNHEASVVVEVHSPVEEAQSEGSEIGWAGDGDLGITSYDDRVAVMAGVAPAPNDRFPHHHEGGDFVERVVHPVSSECGAMTGLVPA